MALVVGWMDLSVQSDIPLGGLKLWLKADDATISLLADGASVTTWTDQSGNSNDVTQATSTKRPLYRTSVAALGNMPAVEFDGTDDILELASSVLTGDGQNSTMFAVLQPTNTTSTQVPVNVGGSFSGLGIASSTNTSKKGWLAGGVAWNSTGVNADTTAEVWTFTIDNVTPTSTLYLDGVAQSPTWTTNPGAAGAATSVGGATSDHFFAGYIAEVLIYGTLLGSTDRQAVEAYLAGKYGL